MDRNLLGVSDTTREHALISLWILVTFVQFPKDELILYPLAGYYAYAAVRDWRLIVPLLKASWPLILITLWTLLCVIWAHAKFAALKHGMMFTLTMMICFVAATRLNQRHIVSSIFGCGFIIGVLSLGNLNPNGASIGVFSHKNMLGANMLILWVAALCLVTDRGMPLVLRLAAPVALALAFFLILKSQSATALVMALCGGALIMGATVFFREQSIFTAGRIGVLALMTGLGIAALALILLTFREDPVMLILDALGKDSSLTGRTLLWHYAEEQIAERPILGVGNGGFWDYWASPWVQRIYIEFYKLPHHNFTFHNSFYEVTVHLGLIGLAFAVAALGWAILRITVAALTRGGMARVFFLVLVVICTIRSTIESDLLRPFALLPMMVWIGALMTVKDSVIERALRQRRRLSNRYRAVTVVG